MAATELGALQVGLCALEQDDRTVVVDLGDADLLEHTGDDRTQLCGTVRVAGGDDLGDRSVGTLPGRPVDVDHGRAQILFTLQLINA